MTRTRRSLLLPAMLAVAVVLFFAVLLFERWVTTRVRPPPEPVVEAAPERAAPPAPPRAEAARTSPATLHRCVGAGAPVYTTQACPPGTRLDRDIAVAVQPSESPDLRRARERCEAGKHRRELELMKLGARRSESDNRVWGDYAARECAEYTAWAR